jgi:hypothetical protein
MTGEVAEGFSLSELLTGKVTKFGAIFKIKRLGERELRRGSRDRRRTGFLAR